MAFVYFILGMIFASVLLIAIFYLVTYNREIISRKIVALEMKNKPESEKGGFIEDTTVEDKILRTLNSK